MSSEKISLETARAYIEQMDLTYIADAMCAASYPLPRWVKEDALHCLKLYKNFLFLHKKYFSHTLVPSREIDEFWHNHILYTKNYFNDCQHIFGHYLHHTPATVDEDTQKLVDDFMKTKQFYFKEFGEDLVVNQMKNQHAQQA